MIIVSCKQRTKNIIWNKKAELEGSAFYVYVLNLFYFKVLGHT